MAVPALRPDVAIIHAQQADRRGNVAIWGIAGIQKEAVLSVRSGHRHGRGDRGRARAAALPGRAAFRGRIDAISVVPGAHPSYADGYYARDNAFYEAWDPIAATARRSASGWSGTCSVPETSREHLREHREEEPIGEERRAPPRERDYTTDEMMTVAASASSRDGAVCFVGMGCRARRRTWPGRRTRRGASWSTSPGRSAPSLTCCRSPSATACSPSTPIRWSRYPRSSTTGCRPVGWTSASWAPPR